MRSPPRLSDVARLAGVSTATVSRALSKPETVARQTRLAVLEAARQTGYRINIAARNLRQRRANAIVVLVPNLSNPFFSEILAGIAETLSDSGLSVLVVDTAQPDGRRRRLFDYLHANRADGIVSLDGSVAEHLMAGTQPDRYAVPIVFACEWASDPHWPTVRVDNEAGAARAVGHLRALGHRHIAHIAGPPDNVLTGARQRGMAREMERFGLDMRPDWVFDGDFGIRSGSAAARRWLSLPERPTAVFTASDQMAFGFISELARSGLGVPADVSVVGFDDIDIAGAYIPALTTVRQPRRRIGSAAAELLLARLAADAAAALPEPQVLDVELIVRASTGPVPAGRR